MNNSTVHSPQMKQCTACGNLFPATREYFYADKRASDGLYGCCKPCFLERAKKSRHKDIEKTRKRELASYYLHHEARLEAGRLYRANNKEKVANRHHEYYVRNKARIKRYQQATLDRCRERTKAWKARHPERAHMLIRINSHKRRALIRATRQSYTPDDVELQMRGQGGNCWWCGKPIKGKFHIDHRIPISKGGANDAGNIVIAHPKCNQSKSDKMPWEWMGRLL